MASYWLEFIVRDSLIMEAIFTHENKILPLNHSFVSNN